MSAQRHVVVREVGFYTFVLCPASVKNIDHSVLQFHIWQVTWPRRQQRRNTCNRAMVMLLWPGQKKRKSKSCWASLYRYDSRFNLIGGAPVPLTDRKKKTMHRTSFPWLSRASKNLFSPSARGLMFCNRKGVEAYCCLHSVSSSWLWYEEHSWPLHNANWWAPPWAPPGSAI